MNVTKGVWIESVQYWGSGSVQVVLTPLWLADDGSVVGTSGQESVSTTRDALTRRAVANGRADGQLGDKEGAEEGRHCRNANQSTMLAAVIRSNSQ